ncbi:Uncharacterised protein [Enterobacter hormaechei]|nr:Uncharacterised protein [Enterobacter hormaechei]CZY79739.1 Uncharacterised protein [Enterobacter hormaechei]CZY80399.1 Uncharacterised protein [Enterobacter hormaechei]SAF26660.1 Uncharacterised protein [Enterobacter hormaechei]
MPLFRAYHQANSSQDDDGAQNDMEIQNLSHKQYASQYRKTRNAELHC